MTIFLLILAITMGADELIVVNLKAPGITRKPKQAKPTIVITPRNQISFFLNFNPEQAKTNIQYGYNDTMKVFHKLDGNIFTFRKGTITKWYHKEQKYLQKKLHKKITRTHFLHLIESLGKSFHLAEYKIYRLYTFKKALCTKVREQEKISSEIKKQLKSLSWKKGSNTKVITLYMLSKLEKNQRIDKRLQTLFKKIMNRQYYYSKWGAIMENKFIYTMDNKRYHTLTYFINKNFIVRYVKSV